MTSPSGNLFQQQEANRRRTSWLVIGFVLFFAWLGFGGDFIAYLATNEPDPDSYHHVFPWLGIVLTSIGIIMAWYSYRKGPESVLWATGAREIMEPQNDAERRLVNVVEEMAIAAGVPRPRIWLVFDDDPNAFATGHGPADSHVAVTAGLLKLCSRDELQGVIGHELGHVKNLDVRLMTTLAALVGAVLLVREGVGRMMGAGRRDRRGWIGSGNIGGGSDGGSGWSSGRGAGGGGDRDRGGGALVAILFALWIISWILAPIITQLLAVAVSRRREFLADAMSAQFTRNPLALASALEKLEHSAAPTAAIKRGAAHLCIVDPLGRRLTQREGWLADRLATHPPMSKRIAILKGMGYAQLKQEGLRV